MRLTHYQCFVHDPNTSPHVDVELFIDDRPLIRLCNCSAYMGGMDSFGNVATMAAEVREDLDALSNTEVVVARDIVDDSIDIFRASDHALMFSMECDRLDGADWVPTYNSGED